MFQFPRAARSGPLASRLGRSAEGFPHSVILGSRPATRLPEAFRGVPRPSSPSGTRGIPRVLCVSFSYEVVNVRVKPGPSKPYHPAHSVPRKEVIQPHLPIRLPCYDFTPIIHPTVDGVVPNGFDRPASGVANSRGVTGGVYKARERIHRRMLIGDY